MRFQSPPFLLKKRENCHKIIKVPLPGLSTLHVKILKIDREGMIDDFICAKKKNARKRCYWYCNIWPDWFTAHQSHYCLYYNGIHRPRLSEKVDSTALHVHETFGTICTIQCHCIEYCSWGRRRGTIIAYTEELFPKGYLFQASGTWKGRVFIVEVYERDFFHFSLLKDQNEITDTFYGCERQENLFKRFIHIVKTVYLQQLKRNAAV